MKKKIGFIGYLGYSVEHPIIGGQMSKTRGIYNELKRQYGENSIVSLDTSNWKKEKVTLFVGMAKIAATCNPIIIMPNKNGIKIILPFFSRLKKIFNFSLSYPVVGGWLTDLLKKYKYLANALKEVDYILPETRQLRDEIKPFTNAKIDVMSIFSTRKPIDEKAIKTNWNDVKNFCTFSRVIPEKGIDEAIEAIKKVNKDHKVCHLDVWGPIDPNYEKHYEELFTANEDNVTYRGVLSADMGLETLSQYYMMLFPTFYLGEGFPTTLCESFMAGLPVIASDWRFNKELVIDGITGFLVPVHDIIKLYKTIESCIDNIEIITKMKFEVLHYSERFSPAEATSELFHWVNSIRKE